MKKNVLYLVTGLLALTSCSQDETTAMDNGGNIKFRPAVSNVTRGTITMITSMNGFKVSAFVEGSASNYFTDQLVNKNGSGWEMKSIYYWPGASTLKFYAYAPTDLANVTINPTVQGINNFSPAAKVAQQKDVVMAYATGTKAANEKAGVELNFKHILSQIEVKAQSANTTDYEVEVLGVKLGQIPSAANFTFPTSWTTPGMMKSYGINVDKSLKLTGTAQNITKSNFLMIPQKLSAWNKTSNTNGVYIGVLCKISHKSGGNMVQVYPPKAGKYAYAIVPVDTQWMSGKKYIYTLNFFKNGGAGVIDPNPEDPDDPNNPNVDPEPGPGGEPVMGGAIKFTVKVEDWVAQPTDVNL